MQSPEREGGLSEIVGFVLILGVIVLVVALYLTYGVPAQGREGEIAHMNAVKDRFVGYKVDVDSLWSNRQCGSAIGTAFTLGTGGSATTGSYSIIPILSPARSTGTLALNQRAEYLTIYSDTYQTVSSGGVTENGSIAVYSSQTPITINRTPGHFFITLKPKSVMTSMFVNATNSEGKWSAWVNVTPVYMRSWNFTLTLASGGRVQEYKNELVDTWNRTDITVSTWKNWVPVVAGMTVIRNITANPSSNYTVDLLNPTYGIADDLSSAQTVYAYESTQDLGGMYYTNYSYAPVVSSGSWLLGSLEYRALNEYWTPQTYYYQMGGVFLEQDDGNTIKVPPAISLSMSDSPVPNTPVVKVNNILLLGNGLVTGSGPAQVTSSVASITQTPLLPGNNTRFVNITVQAANANAALAWRNYFQTAAEQANFPSSIYSVSNSGYVSWINISPDRNIYGVQFSMNQVNVNTALQSAVPPAGG